MLSGLHDTFFNSKKDWLALCLCLQISKGLPCKLWATVTNNQSRKFSLNDSQQPSATIFQAVREYMIILLYFTCDTRDTQGCVDFNIKLPLTLTVVNTAASEQEGPVAVHDVDFVCFVCKLREWISNSLSVISQQCSILLD